MLGEHLSVNHLTKYIAQRLKQGYKISTVINTTLFQIRKYKRKKRLANISGYKIRWNGRFSRKDRATHAFNYFGAVPFSSYDTPLAYSSRIIRLKNGICSIRLWLAFGNTPKVSKFFSRVKNYLFRSFYFKRGRRYKFLKDYFRFLKKSKKLTLRRGQRKYFYYKSERVNPFSVLSNNDFFNRFVYYNLKKNLYLYKLHNICLFKKLLKQRKNSFFKNTRKRFNYRNTTKKNKDFKFHAKLKFNPRKEALKNLRNFKHKIKGFNLTEKNFISNKNPKLQQKILNLLASLKNYKIIKAKILKNKLVFINEVSSVKSILLKNRLLLQQKQYRKFTNKNKNIIDTLCFYYKKYIKTLIKKIHKSKDDLFLLQKISFYLKLFRASYKIFVKFFNKFLKSNKF